MAEKEEKNKTEEPKKLSVSSEKPIFFIVLACANMLVVISIGIMLFLSRKSQVPTTQMDEMIEKERESEHHEETTGEHFESAPKLIPLEPFLVNLSQSHGRKLIKVSVDLDVSDEKVVEEIDIKKPVIRDMIITILSSKTYLEVSTKEGKENLREEIKNQLNRTFVQGEIRGVYFTEFIYN